MDSVPVVLKSAGRATERVVFVSCGRFRAKSTIGSKLSAVELLYVENIITRRKGAPQQVLTFYLLVENRTYSKEVAVRWAGEDGAWHTLPATYVSHAGDNREIWRAQTWLQADEQRSLPGNVRFALYCRTGGREYWENNGGADYQVEADAGIYLPAAAPVRNVDYGQQLQPDQRVLGVTVAVQAGAVDEVIVEWSTDGWKTVKRTPCFYQRDHWDRNVQSNARNPNQYGVQIWTGRLKLRDAYRVEYAVGCRRGGEESWDNNRGANYMARRADLKVLTLNLHCYQEADQDAKLSRIAAVIAELDIDIVCLQEVAEDWNDGHGNWNSNAARLIAERIGRTYHLHTDWSHQGFGRYREGVAILSKHPLLKQEARYVSTSQDRYDIHARKAVMVQVDVPGIGVVNVFSAHLSWWQDGFRQQYDALVDWAERARTRQVAATLLCGDFNIKAGAEGYRHLVDSGRYEDQFLKIDRRAVFDAVFRQPQANWPALLAGDHRIDYILLNRASKLKATGARVLFTDDAYGRVSDHVGFFVTFEPR